MGICTIDICTKDSECATAGQKCCNSACGGNRCMNPENIEPPSICTSKYSALSKVNFWCGGEEGVGGGGGETKTKQLTSS